MATVLVVDDHLATRELLRSLFEYRGFGVLLAKDASEAIVLAEEHSPDLIVTDIVMPGIDGFSLLQLLRSQTSCKATPVVMMSASLEAERARQLAERCGAREYLAKPFAPEAVLELADRFSPRSAAASG